MKSHRGQGNLAGSRCDVPPDAQHRNCSSSFAFIRERGTLSYFDGCYLVHVDPPPRHWGRRFVFHYYLSISHSTISTEPTIATISAIIVRLSSIASTALMFENDGARHFRRNGLSVPSLISKIPSRRGESPSAHTPRLWAPVRAWGLLPGHHLQADPASALRRILIDCSISHTRTM